MFALYQTAGLFWSYSIFTCVAITFYIFVRKGHPRVPLTSPLEGFRKGPLGGLQQWISATPQKSPSHARGMCAPNFTGQWIFHSLESDVFEDHIGHDICFYQHGWKIYSQMNSKPSLFSNDKIPEEQLSFRNSFFCDDFPMFCTSGWRAFKFVGVRCFLKVPNGNVQVHPHSFEILIFWSLLNRSDIQLNYFPEFSHIRPRDSHLNAIF